MMPAISHIGDFLHASRAWIDFQVLHPADIEELPVKTVERFAKHVLLTPTRFCGAETLGEFAEIVETRSCSRIKGRRCQSVQSSVTGIDRRLHESDPLYTDRGWIRRMVPSPCCHGELDRPPPPLQGGPNARRT